MIAITRRVPSSLASGLLTFMDRDQVDVDLAEKQHQAYEELLRDLGLEVISLPAQADMPDSVFVEDSAVVLDEVVIITRPASEERRREVPWVADELRHHHQRLEQITEPATVEGGDVLVIDRDVFVGRSSRTNDRGFRQLREILSPFGYNVCQLEVASCLHLKTACTRIGPLQLLANPDWIDVSALCCNFEVMAAADGEDFAANALFVGDTVVLASSFPKTRAILEQRGFNIRTVDISELQKLEAGLTCCSLLMERVTRDLSVTEL